MEQPAPAQNNNTMKIVIAVVVGLVACCVLVPICVIVILALLGPAIGNVFSNVILGI